MNYNNRLMYTKWNCKYYIYIVFMLKYYRIIFYEENKRDRRYFNNAVQVEK